MNDNVKNFLNALIMVAKFAEPQLVITKTKVEEEITSNSITYHYTIEGHADESDVKVMSRGTIDVGSGMQIEVIKNGQIRMFPFFGFNWQYLKLYTSK